MVRRALALAGALAAIVLLPASPAYADQSSTCAPSLQCEFTAPSSSPATSDTFVASFEHPSDVNIDQIAMAVTSAPPSGCQAPAPQTDPAPSTPSSQGATATTTSAPMSFGFDCNGVYTIQATGHATASGPCGGIFQPSCPIDPTITWTDLTVAIPAPQVDKLTTSVDSGGGVTISWTYPGTPPHDFLGYALNRIDQAGHRVALQIAANATSYQDVDVPSNGTYTYEVVSRRSGAAPTSTVSRPTLVILPPGTTSPTDTSSSPAPPPNTGGGGSAPSTRAASVTPGGPPMFDPPTLADDTEPGDPNAQGPNASGAAAVQHFGDSGGGIPGAGLVKPFAAALAASVWAGLFLFLSRRAVSADRALRALHVEELE